LTPRCHACGRDVDELWTRATDIEYGTTADEFSYYLCRHCDALSIDPLPADRLHEIYPETYYSFASSDSPLEPERNLVTRVKARLDARTFRRALSHTRGGAVRILDVGGGTGDIAAKLVDAAGPGASAVVVDIDADSIELARRRGLEGFLGRFEDYETVERFDVILMLNLIEHVADPSAMLARAATLLAPGGVLWLQTPNFRSVDARLFGRWWAGLHCPRHWVIFSDSGLERALARSGLDAVELQRTQGGAFWAASAIGRTGAGRARPDGRLPKPVISRPAFLPLAALGAAFDIATSRFRRTSQVTVFARRAG
jgi:SAM-dependent methyltransferase